MSPARHLLWRPVSWKSIPTLTTPHPPSLFHINVHPLVPKMAQKQRLGAVWTHYICASGSMMIQDGSKMVQKATQNVSTLSAFRLRHDPQHGCQVRQQAWSWYDMAHQPTECHEALLADKLEEASFVHRNRRWSWRGNRQDGWLMPANSAKISRYNNDLNNENIYYYYYYFA